MTKAPKRPVREAYMDKWIHEQTRMDTCRIVDAIGRIIADQLWPEDARHIVKLHNAALAYDRKKGKT